MIIKKKNSSSHRRKETSPPNCQSVQDWTKTHLLFICFCFAPRSTQLGVVVPNKSQFGFFCALHYAKYIFAVCPSTQLLCQHLTFWSPFSSSSNEHEKNSSMWCNPQKEEKLDQQEQFCCCGFHSVIMLSKSFLSMFSYFLFYSVIFSVFLCDANVFLFGEIFHNFSIFRYFPHFFLCFLFSSQI